MDVILDANILLELIFSLGRGFIGTNQFFALLTYLRRVNHRLVLPLLVFQEVAEVYRRELAERTAKAETPWDRMSQILISDDRRAFLGPSITHEVNELRRLLRNPGPNIRTLIYSDYTGVDVAEVIRRGIKRRPPANSEGEELRDVALWLTTLHYAAAQPRPVAFVTHDKHFLDEHRSGLHPVLVQEIRSRGVDIRFYPSIGGFVAGNSISSEPLSEDWSSRFLPLDNLQDEATRYVSSLKIRQGVIRSVSLTDLRLVSGEKYEVGENSYYVEGTYSARCRLAVTSQVWAPNALTSIQVPLWTGLPLSTLPMTSQAVDLASQTEPNPGILAYNLNATPMIYASQIPPFNSVTTANLASGISGSNIFASSAWTSREATCLADLSLAISARVVNGARESLQIDRAELTNIRDIEPADA
jgi:hypothetical protein